MTLSERLMKVTEEKVKLECENQKLRENCIAWQQSQNRLTKCIDEVLEDKSRISKERHKYFMENLELSSYKHSADVLFIRCASFIVQNKEILGIKDYLIEELGLNNIGKKAEMSLTEKPMNTEKPKNDDILDLFKQSSNEL